MCCVFQTSSTAVTKKINAAPKEVRFDTKVITHEIPLLDSFAVRELFYSRQDTKHFKQDLQVELFLRELLFLERR